MQTPDAKIKEFFKPDRDGIFDCKNIRTEKEYNIVKNQHDYMTSRESRSNVDIIIFSIKDNKVANAVHINEAVDNAIRTVFNSETEGGFS